MSRKVTSVTANDIRKSVSIANSSHPAQSEKPDFKLKKVTGAKSAFGVASLCATGTVFGAVGSKD